MDDDEHFGEYWPIAVRQWIDRLKLDCDENRVSVKWHFWMRM